MKYNITPPDTTVYNNIKKNWDLIAKPLSGLGIFEELAARIGAIQGSEDVNIKNRAAIIMCADNGIISEGVSQSEADVTLTVARLMGQNNSSVCHLGASTRTEIIPVDIGICSDEILPGVLNEKVSRGTNNFLIEAAMTEEQCHQAIDTGIRLIGDYKKRGYDLIAAGEMGIGNTTTAAAVCACLLSLSADEVTGRGAGLGDTGLKRKTEVIEKAIELYGGMDTFSVLQGCGGLDIAGMTGLYIGGAVHHIPIIIDGAVSAVAALCARSLCPGSEAYMIPSHAGKEGISSIILQELGLYSLTPIHANMAFGEGTGAVLLPVLLDAVLALYRDGMRFSQTPIEEYVRFDDDDSTQSGEA